MAKQNKINATAAKVSVKSDFRRALGQFPTGVTVITTTDDQSRPVGMTVSSFNSVSQEPSLILWSIDKSALSLKAFSQGKHFAVNVLGQQQIDIADNFARRGADKFTNILFSEGRDGCPVLDDTAACFECKTWQVYEGGDHLIVVGEVLSHHYRDQVMPLVFAQSSYAVPVQHAAIAASGSKKLSADGFLENHLLYLLWSVHALYSSKLYQLLLGECGVAPEEWRILTLLLDSGLMDAKSIAQAASQPMDDCHNTLARMQRDDYLLVDGNKLVRLTESGTALTKRLVATAKRHEAEVISALAKGRQEELKQDLRAILTKLKEH